MRIARCGLALLLGLTAARTWPQQSTAPPPGVEIRAEAQPAKATVGDPIVILISAVLPPGLSAESAPLHGQAGEFSVLEFQSLPAAGEPGPGKATTSPAAATRVIARAVVALYRTGRAQFPSLPVVIHDGGGRKYSVPSPPVNVEIDSVLGPQDDRLKDLRQQAQIEEPVRWLFWLSVILLVLTAFLAAWLLWRKRRGPLLPHPSVPGLDPFALAEAELRDLASRDLPGRGLVKHFYVMLSDIVRRIIEAGYSIPATERTTSEITDALRENRGERDPIEDALRIESLLSGCDLVKFARYVPPRKEDEAALQTALAILARCRQRVEPDAGAATTPGEETGVPSR